MTFGVFRTLLESMDQEGWEEYKDDWDDRVSERLVALEEAYQELRVPDRELIDYSDLSTQAAYVFMYAIGRAEFTFQLLQRVRHELGEPLFDGGLLQVTSIGGGPGSELAGLVKYLEDEAAGESVTSIVFRVLDKESNWEATIEGLRDALETDIHVEVVFAELDVCDPEKTAAIDLSGDEFVILSFFISEVCETMEKAQIIRSLNYLLGTMTSGAKLFYNDSDAYSFYRFMNYRASAAGLEQLVEIQDKIVVRSPDFDGIYEEYIEDTGRTPHLNSKAVAKFFRRK